MLARPSTTRSLAEDADHHQAASGDLEASRRSKFQLPQQKGLRTTLWLAATSLGVIYGDIGTSPLYVLNAIFPSSGPIPGQEDVVGAVSAVIWAITIIPLIKYSIIALEFGNGSQEGGPFAIFTTIYPPLEESDENRALTNYTTTSLGGAARHRRFLDRPWIKGTLLAWCLFGTCLTISDGLLTPAVSVTSAVVGISVAAPSVASSVVGISIAILVILFLIQGFGTHRVGGVFAPVVFVWLSLNLISGIINITHHPGIFRAFDPSRAVMLFVRTGDFDLLAGVLLAITGVEALFANLGQFSKQSIRLSFACYVYPCLIFAYLGQGAKLITAPEATLPNVFFQSIPGGVGKPYWWITWLMAVLAAVIASQAMITATFSLVQQLTRLRAMPSVKIVHTADRLAGQITVPSVNILLMIGTIGLTVGFGTDAALTNAYGFAVSGVLIVTTSFIAISIVEIKHLPVVLGVVFLLVSGFFDGIFWGSALKKVPHGAWFPLGLAVLLTLCFMSWSWAKQLETNFDKSHRHRLQDLIRLAREQAYPTIGNDNEKVDPSDAFEISPPHLTTADQPIASRRPSYEAVGEKSASLRRLNVMAFFHSASNAFNGAPESFGAFIRSYPSLPEVMVFFNVRVVGVPHTSDEDRLAVSRVRSFEGIYIATLRLGYRDDIDLSNLALPVRQCIADLEERSGSPDFAERLARVDMAMNTAVTHILPHFYVTAAHGAHHRIVQYMRAFLIESIYRRVAVNFDEYDSYKFGPKDNVLRMGVSAPL